MSTPIADMVEKMLSGGIPPEIVVDAVRAAEQHAQSLIAGDPVAARRRAYDRERKRKIPPENSTGIPSTSSVSSSFPTENASKHSTGNENALVSSSLLPFSKDSYKEESKKEEVTRAREGRFEQFWDAYPHKVGKQAARKSFERAAKDVPFGQMMDALLAYRNKTDDRPWCNPATWLNQHRWHDKPGPQQNGRLDQNTGSKSVSALAREFGRSLVGGTDSPVVFSIPQGRLPRPAGFPEPVRGYPRTLSEARGGVCDGPADGGSAPAEIPAKHRGSG